MLNVTEFSQYSNLCIEDATQALARAEGVLFSILWDVELKEKTEVYNGNGELNLVLKRYPVTLLSSLKFSGEEVDDTTYYVQEDTGIIERSVAFPRWHKIISVQYTAGWDDTNIPIDLKYAVYDLACKIASAGLSYGSNVKSESIDGASITWWDIEKSKEEAVILSYKRIYV